MPRSPGGARERSEKNRAAPLPIVGRVIIVDADSVAASAAADVLASDGHDVEIAVDRKHADRFDVVVINPGAEEAAAVVESLRPAGAHGKPEVIITSALHDVDAAVAALHRGASDWLVKPVAEARLRLAIGRALERRRLLSENAKLQRDLALFAAAQRVLETLDRQQLAAIGADALCSVSGAQASLVWADDVTAARGLSVDEVDAVRSRMPTLGFMDQVGGHEVGVDRFARAVILDVGDGVTVASFFDAPPERAAEEGLLFLARQLGTAFKNSQRFKDAAEQALRDPLTSLWNAQAFSRAIERQVDEQREPFSVLFVDIDHFKSVNDRHGHLVGSRVLVEIARTIERTLREGDVVSRYGGDELTALLPACDTADAQKVAERVRQAVAGLRFAATPELTVSCSIGVASFPRHASTARDLMDAADRAMYAGKATTRNQVNVARPLPKPA